MDLTKRAPRSPYHISILGTMNLARMADKAVAKLNNTLGEYKSGETSGRDRRTLSALGLSEKQFLEIIKNSSADGRTSDAAIAAQLSQQVDIDLEKTKAFNVAERNRTPLDEDYRRRFEERRRIIGQPEIISLPDMLDAEDMHDFGVPSNLTLAPPVSPHSGGILGIVCLGRLISKAKGFLAGKLGEYKFGDNSGLDVNVMQFVGLTEAELLDGIGKHVELTDLLPWLRHKINKSQREVADWNQDRRSRGPWNQKIQKMFDQRIEAVGRLDLTTFLDLLDCEDAADFPQ